MTKQLTFLISLVIASMAILFGLQVYSIYAPEKRAFFISPNHVEGSAVVYKKQPFTLNFEQQKAVLEVINSGPPSTAKEIENLDTRLPKWSKILFYIFDKETVNIIPVGYFEGRLLYSINHKIYMDNDEHTLDETASNAFDREE